MPTNQQMMMMTLTEAERAILLDPYSCHTVMDFIVEPPPLLAPGQAHRCGICGDAIDEEEYHWECRRCRETGAVRRPVKRSPKKKPQKPPTPKHGFPRYPGGKFKLLDEIMPNLRTMAADLGDLAEYREPFLGGGAVALAVLKERLTERAWLNEFDPALAAYWNSVLHDVGNLGLFINIISEASRRFPNTDYHHLYRNSLKKIILQSDIVDHVFVGFQKLACHRMSFSGLGTAGGKLPDTYSRFKFDKSNGSSGIPGCYEETDQRGQ